MRGLAADPGARHPAMNALLRAVAAERRRRPRTLLAIAALALMGLSVLGARSIEHRVNRCAGGPRRLATAWDAARKQHLVDAFAATGQAYAPAMATRVVERLDAFGAAWQAEYTDACEATEVRGEQSEELLDARVACLDDRLSELRGLGDLFARADADLVRRSVRAASDLTSVASCADLRALAQPQRPPRDPATQARVEATRAELAHVRSQLRAGRYADGLREAQATGAAAQQIGYRPLEAEALYWLGAMQMKTGDARAAEATLVQAASAALAGHHGRVAAQSWIDLLALAKQPDRRTQREEWSRYADAALEALGPEPDLRALQQLHLGNAALEAARLADAQAAYEKALAIWRDLQGPTSPRIADCLAQLGQVLEEQARLPEALHAAEEALALRRSIYGDEHPDVATAIENRASVLLDQGKLDEALAGFQDSLGIRQRTLGPDHPNVAAAFNQLGIVYRRLGRYDDSKAAYERALAIKEKRSGSDSLDYANSLGNLANLAGTRGDLDEALRLHSRVLEIRQRKLGPDHPLTGDTTVNVAIAHNLLAVKKTGAAATAEYEAALAYDARALAIYQKAYGPRHPSVAAVLCSMGEIRLDMKQPAAAIAPLEQALPIARESDGDPGSKAHVLLTLGRALWDGSRDHRRAVALGEEALALVRGKPGTDAKGEVRDAEGWLAAHHR